VPLSQTSSNDASQEILLDALPPVLVLHLERFLYDVTADGIVKISKPIELAPELEIPLGAIISFVFPAIQAKNPCGFVGLEIVAPVSGESAEPVHYKLYGVLYHHGESVGSGHYTVDVLHPNEDSSGGEGWLRIDDEAVRAVQHEDVFGAHDNEQVDDRSAYMLFYCRTALTGT
jgi:ubiquitin carboxyl-terminal hydrolase 10